jgi:hypothetical protein
MNNPALPDGLDRGRPLWRASAEKGCEKNLLARNRVTY